MKAIIALEDGTAFEGTSFGAEGEVVGEVVFNTQVVGYQEILTDPSYRKQIIVMGYPHIGNYGINDRCNESGSTHASALVIKENSKIYSNWQAKGSLEDFMKKNKVIGIEGVDTRALVVHIRDNGEMRGVVSTKDFDKETLVKKAKAYRSPDLAEEIKSQIPNPKSQTNPKSQFTNSKTVIINLGVNNSTLSKFEGALIVPYDISAEKILEMGPEQVVISSGPGDPRMLSGLVGEVKKLIMKVPIYGIQNGACVLALALGCTVYRMKAGHHGVNHPVVDPKTGKGEISAQNHSYGIEKVPENVEAVHVNLNDKTIEKFKTKDGKCVGTLYFPIDERSKLDPDYQYV
ncbi:MAG: glutamine-hydrolyzing carbamoyl-phosphate synthase small subunit [Candidatus Saganbacteria bacterium]|nr:glutamine-hydrolyzing carbamoyl-phosphate synthase small subunit [Candidatus Saganbacteria bacterium]